MNYTASITFTAGTIEVSVLEGLRESIKQFFKDWVIDHFNRESETVDVSIVVDSERIGIDLEVEIPADDWEMGWTLWLDRLENYLVGTTQVVVEKMFDARADRAGQAVIHMSTQDIEVDMSVAHASFADALQAILPDLPLDGNEGLVPYCLGTSPSMPRLRSDTTNGSRVLSYTPSNAQRFYTPEALRLIPGDFLSLTPKGSQTLITHTSSQTPISIDTPTIGEAVQFISLFDFTGAFTPMSACFSGDLQTLRDLIAVYRASDNPPSMIAEIELVTAHLTSRYVEGTDSRWNRDDFTKIVTTPIHTYLQLLP